MSRRIFQDGKYYRVRRGKLVQIPPEWVGITLHRGTTGPFFRSWKRVFRDAEKTQEETRLRREYKEELVDLCLNPRVLSL